MSNIKNILVTGGSGNAGQYICREFAEQGYTVTIFDKMRPEDARNPWETEIPCYLGDFTDQADCFNALVYSQADAIVHFGAMPSPSEVQPVTKNQPKWRARGNRMREDTSMNVNTMGTYYLLEAARKLGVGVFVFASTFYVSGIGFRISDKPFQVDYLPIDEEHPCRPECTYGANKLMGEILIAAYCRAYDMRGVAFRLMGIRPPHREFKYPAVIGSNPDHVGGPRGGCWQYVEARDVAKACVLAVEKDLGKGSFEAFYISTDTEYDEPTADVLKRNCPDLADMADNIEGTDGVFSNEKIIKLLGYKPQFSWRNEG